MTGPHESASLSMTTSHLLDGLKDPLNQTVWHAYVERYRPLMIQYGIRLGLSATDAEDAAQLSLIEFCTAYQADKYDRTRGRLRDWLFGIARNQVLNYRRRQVNRGPMLIGDGSSGTDFFNALPDDNSLTQIWEDEWQQAVMQQCLATVRSEVEARTFEAFELFALKGMPAEEVASRLDMSANAVFGAKRRILRRIRELLPQLQDEW